jgi:hypothetical protein
VSLLEIKLERIWFRMKKSSSVVLIFLICFVLSTLPPVRATEDSWITKTPMPPQLGGSVRAGVVNGKIYVMGNSLNFEYDPESDSWVEKTPIPTIRNSFGLAVSQNKIYAIGGSRWNQSQNANIHFCTNEVYDPLTDTWETKEPMPTYRSGLWSSTNAVQGKIHLINSDFHDIYDIATDSWTTGTPMPSPLAYTKFSSTVFDDKIYLLGDTATQIYDPESETWSLGTASPVGTYTTTACATTGVMAPKKIYVFGMAIQLFTGTNITQVYDPMNDSWTLGAPMLTARTGPACAVVNDEIYVLGGMSGRLQFVLVNEQYTPVGYIPEFPSWITLPLVLIATLVVIIYKKRMKQLRAK